MVSASELQVSGRLYPLTLASLLLVVGAVVEKVLAQGQIRTTKLELDLLTRFITIA